MNFPTVFNRVTFGLPAETFRVEAYIALDERIPVVTEFVLRLLHVCGKTPILAFREYFGFSDGEALSVIESLSRQGLIEVLDEDIQLSLFSKERFDEAGGDHPRFNKVELKKDTVTFDLISFTPIVNVNSDFAGDSIIKLDTTDEALGDSISRARRAYSQRYPEIAALKNELRENSYGVHSIEDIESKRRSYIPISVSFGLDQDGQVVRNYDETFNRSAPEELINFFNEQVSSHIPRTFSLANPGLSEFIDTFDLKLMGQYLVGKKFDILGYLADVHIAKNVKYQSSVKPFFGNIYLQDNADLVEQKISEMRNGLKRSGKLLTSLAWMAPSYELWGRGDSYHRAVTKFSNILKTSASGDSLHLFLGSEYKDDGDIAGTYRSHRLLELHTFRPVVNDIQPMIGRLELMLYPAGFIIALYHISVPGVTGLWAPIGIMSSLPKHLEITHKLLQSILAKQNYAGKLNVGRRQQQDAMPGFEENCPFLNYCSTNF